MIHGLTVFVGGFLVPSNMIFLCQLIRRWLVGKVVCIWLWMSLCWVLAKIFQFYYWGVPACRGECFYQIHNSILRRNSLILVKLEDHLNEFGIWLTVIEKLVHCYGMFIVEHLIRECSVWQGVDLCVCVIYCWTFVTWSDCIRRGNPSIHPSIHPSVCMSVRLSVRSSTKIYNEINDI